jgi:hypothetical protein
MEHGLIGHGLPLSSLAQACLASKPIQALKRPLATSKSARSKGNPGYGMEAGLGIPEKRAFIWLV